MNCYITVVTDLDETTQDLYINSDFYERVCDLSECPEDAIIGRSLQDCGDLAYAIELGFNIAKSYDSIKILHVTSTDLDSFDINEYMEEQSESKD